MTTTPFSPVELDRRVDAALAELRNRNATPGPSRRLSASARKRLSEGVVAHHARCAAADPNASPLRRARYARGWSLRTAGRGSLSRRSRGRSGRHRLRLSPQGSRNMEGGTTLDRQPGAQSRTYSPEESAAARREGARALVELQNQQANRDHGPAVTQHVMPRGR